MGGIKGFDANGKPLAAPDAATADEMFSRGELRFQRGTRIPVRDADGTIGTILAEDYASARQTGMALVSEAEHREYQERKKYESESGVEAAVKAGAGATLDTFTALGAHIGVTKEFRDISRDALQNRAKDRDLRYEASPTASLVGEIGAAVAPAVVSGGASLALRGGAQVSARGLAAATARASVSGISEVAGTTASNLAIKLAASAGVRGTLARKAIGLAAQGIAEGSIQGAREGLIQGTLDDTGKTAEAIAMGALQGAKYGAIGNLVFGGAIGAAGSAARVSTNKMRDLAARVTRNAAAEVGEAVPQVSSAAALSATERFLGVVDDAPTGGAAKLAAKATGADASDVANMMRAEGASAIDNPEKWLDGATREMTEGLDTVVDAIEEMDDELFKGAGKLETIQKVSGGTIDAGAAAARASDFIADARERISALRANAGEFEKFGALNKLANGFDSGEYESRIAKAAQSDDAGSAIMFELDSIKREIGYAAKQRPGDIGPVQGVKDQLADVYDAVRVHLEDDAVWGGAASMQREVNEGWTLGLRQSRKYNKSFREVTGSQGFEVLRRHDPTKVKSYVRTLGEFEARNNDDALAEMLEGSRKRAESYRRWLGDERATKAIKSIDGVRDSWRKLTIENKARTGAEKVAAQSQRRLVGGAALAGAAGLAGMASGHDSAGLTAGASVFAAAAAKPHMLAQALASARTMLGKRSGAILSASGGVARRARGASRLAARHGGRVARAAGVGALMVHYRDKIREVAEAPATVDTSDLDVITPGLGQAVEARRAAAVKFLQSKMPSGAFGSGAFGHLAGPAVSTMEARRFMAYVRGVEEPLGVLEDVSRGVYSPESIEAVREVYPQTYAEMQQVVMEQLTDLKKPPPYESRRELGILFGIPSDFIFTPGAMQRLSDAGASDEATAQQQPAPGKASGGVQMPNLSGAFRTETQRIQARE